MAKTSAKELERRKERARLDDKHRQWIEAELKAGRSPEELGLDTLELSPAMEFIRVRLNGLADFSNLHDEVRRVMIDLLCSDTPLDRKSRQWIAQMFARPDPKADRQRKKRAFVQAAADLKGVFKYRGMTALDAEHAVAENFGLSLTALRKKIERARK